MTSATTLACLVLLLVIANGSPIVARRILYNRMAWPVDGGLQAWDGRPLFGRSKTWRGLVVAIALTSLAAALLGLGALFGALFGAAAMAGDLISSFLKRRRGLAPSARATGLDQFPEALLPLILSHWWLDVGWLVIIAAALIFFAIVTLLSPVLYRLGIRRRPH